MVVEISNGSSSGSMGSPGLHYRANTEMGRGGMEALGLMVQSGDPLTTDTKFTVLSRVTSSWAKDTIKLIINRGPGLVFKEKPPDFDVQQIEGVMIFTIIKNVTRYKSFVSKEMLYCCNSWSVLD